MPANVTIPTPPIAYDDARRFIDVAAADRAVVNAINHHGPIDVLPPEGGPSHRAHRLCVSAGMLIIERNLQGTWYPDYPVPARFVPRAVVDGVEVVEAVRDHGISEEAAWDYLARYFLGLSAEARDSMSAQMFATSAQGCRYCADDIRRRRGA